MFVVDAVAAGRDSITEKPGGDWIPLLWLEANGLIIPQ